MRDNGTENLKELTQATSIKLNLSQFAVEKDFYITKAIYALTRVEDEYFSLIFQGGTSLSKAIASSIGRRGLSSYSKSEGLKFNKERLAQTTTQLQIHLGKKPTGCEVQSTQRSN